MQNNKLISAFIKLITIMFTVIMAALTMMSLVYHTKVDIYTYDLPRNVERHSPVLYTGMAIVTIAVLIGIIWLISIYLDRNEKKWSAAYIVMAVCTVFTVAASIFWILFNDAIPRSDQAVIFNEARIMAGFSEAEYDTSYFGWFPRNRGLVLLMSLLLRIFGDTQIAFRGLNVIGAVLLSVFVFLITKQAWKKPQVTVLTGLLLSAYYPIVIYTSYLYGTLLSTALASCGFFAAVDFCDKHDSRSIWGAAICFPLAIQMHQSASIAMIAAVIYVLIHAAKKTIWKTAAFVFFPIVVIVMLNRAVDTTYERITGAEQIDPVPSIAWIYMGITSNNELGGPGCQDGSMYELYVENGHDSEKTGRDAVKKILNAAGEYFRGERSLSFFVEKTKHQWLDPTFTARRVMRLNEVDAGEPPNSDAYTALYNSGIREVIFKLLIVYMIVIYGLNLFAGFRQLQTGHSYRLHFLIQIFFIGGFVFQLMWESIARYCFSYFIWLIPEAAYGVYFIYEIIFGKIKQSFPKAG